MRALVISGAILVAAGIFLILRPPTYSHEESVFKLGDVEARMQEKRPIPGWIGGALLGAGCVVVVVGLKRKSS